MYIWGTYIHNFTVLPSWVYVQLLNAISDQGKNIFYKLCDEEVILHREDEVCSSKVSCSETACIRLLFLRGSNKSGSKSSDRSQKTLFQFFLPQPHSFFSMLPRQIIFLLHSHFIQSSPKPSLFQHHLPPSHPGTFCWACTCMHTTYNTYNRLKYSFILCIFIFIYLHSHLC